MKINHKKLNVVLGISLVTVVLFWGVFLYNNSKQYPQEEQKNNNQKEYFNKNNRGVQGGISHIKYLNNKYAVKVNRDIGNLQNSEKGNFFNTNSFTSYFMTILINNLPEKYKAIEYRQYNDKYFIEGVKWISDSYQGVTNEILFMVTKNTDIGMDVEDRFYLELVKHPECEENVNSRGQNSCKEQDFVASPNEIKMIINEVLKRAGY